MLLTEVATTSVAVAATSSRLAKRDLLADLLRRTPIEDLPVVLSYLAGELPQRRTGVGWASLTDLPTPVAAATLEVRSVDQLLTDLARLTGAGSTTTRRDQVRALFAVATADEQRLLRGLLSGEIRQGALDAALLDAVAAASTVPVQALRRAAMLRGSTPPVAVAALTGGLTAVSAFALELGRPVRPMLAASAVDVATAVRRIPAGHDYSIDTKLDGVRIQAHRADGQVRLFTRSLEEVTERLDELADLIATWPGGSLILDLEAVVRGPDGRARPFAETASRAASSAGAPLVPAVFDILHRDGESLIDRPLSERLAQLDEAVPTPYRIARVDRPEPSDAAAFFDAAVAAGHEGVVIKDLSTPYEAGRRGAGWIKVKPRHTVDLVVLAVERGSGRRRGKLSNIHLGARDGRTGAFMMLGKTFKGMTDAMLDWQTARFSELALDVEAEHTLQLRPEQVVEVAFDGVQRSRRYPGGVALRFARVVRYRADKTPEEIEDIDAIRALLA